MSFTSNRQLELKKYLKWLAPLSVICYIASMFMPSIVYIPSLYSYYSPLGYSYPVQEIDRGYEILINGWLSLFMGGIVAWYANIVFFIALSVARFKKYKKALILSVTAFTMGLQAYSFTIKPLDEGGVKNLIVNHFASGYYVWMLSFVILGLYCFLKLKDFSIRKN